MKWARGAAVFAATAVCAEGALSPRIEAGVQELVDNFFEVNVRGEAPVTPDDPSLSQAEIKERIAGCFELTHNHVVSNQPDYERIAFEASERKGLRSDDAVRFFFHATIVACYNNLTQETLTAMQQNSLSDEQIDELLGRDAETPVELSPTLYTILAEVLSAYQADEDEAVSESKGDGMLMAVGGVAGVAMAVSLLAALSGVVFFAVRRLLKAEQAKQERKKKRTGNGATSTTERKKVR